MNVTVKPGYHVITPAKTYQPGESLELDDKEANRLVKSGIVEEGGEVPTSASAPLNVPQTVELVTAAQTIEELEKLAEGETRKGVQTAIEKRRAELTPPAE